MCIRDRSKDIVKAVGDVGGARGALRAEPKLRERRPAAQPSIALSIDERLDILDQALTNNEISQEVYDTQVDAVYAEEATPAAAPVAKPKVKTKPKKKPARTTDLGPKDPASKKIMRVYEEGMEGKTRTNYTAKNPLPGGLENKLVPLFEGYINSLSLIHI